MCPRHSNDGQFGPTPHTMSANRQSPHRIERMKFPARSDKLPNRKKQPGMALQNLHPRFKSGRRLQS
jgi:hypothetical protein